MADTEPLTPDAERWALDAFPRAVFPGHAGDTLRIAYTRGWNERPASLPREDADLDAIDQLLARRESNPEWSYPVEHLADAAPALLARVRTAEAGLAALDDACPGCDGSETCPAPAHQHGCFADTEGHCNDPGEHASRTVETAEEWEYAWTDADGGVHEDEIPERALICAKATGGRLLRARPRVWETYSEPVPPTSEEGDRG
ncbi:hypothetical protein [Rathayibacter sp. AY2B5]|uniref:hypothetical protein n=1 Tax=Rathayibacter sp. AY2B5 TaxID=2080570 RepID=UPI000CE83706|nr:hypothetical protein [Rathayibacter sp. AY2B5]PPG36320.1 hypothetical protein C5C30_16150 [Rathayibacter sp. AY2B5]